MSDHISNVSRRDFLKKTAGGAAATAGTLALPGVVRAAERPTRYAMVVDTRRCMGCHACSVTCKTSYEVPLGETRSWVEYVEKGDYPNVRRSFLPRLCNQCDEPGCVSVCPTGATYQRTDGIVAVEDAVCIGCKYCMQACPYGMRFINPTTGSAEKCDFCLTRVANGLVPSCVNTCQGRARIFGDLNDPSSEVSRVLATNAVTVLRPEMGTKPMVFYINADHVDERDAGRTHTHVQVITHRRQQTRV